MRSFNYTITNPIGIHMKPAAAIVSCAEKFDCSISITKGPITVKAKTLIGTIALAVKHGETVTLTFNGVDEDEAYDALLAHFQKNL